MDEILASQRQVSVSEVSGRIGPPAPEEGQEF
jgi:hypothetical protein